jgi:hypothetical protein
VVGFDPQAETVMYYFDKIILLPQISIPISSSPKKLPQYYCFSTGRHSGSFFLKSGATLFCLGHIIHIVLNLIKQVRIQFFTKLSPGRI